MNKILKYSLLATAALFVVFLLMLAYVVITVNPNDYKPQIIELVRDEMHRNLTLEGNIGLKLFPRIGLNLGKASLSGPGGKGEFASVDNAVVDLAWMPLLHGKMEIDRIDIDGLNAGFVRHRDGTTNYEDLTGRGGKGGTSKAEFDIGAIDVKHSMISFEDEKTGKKYEFSDISLKTGRLKEGVHSDIAMGFDMKEGGAVSRIDLKSGLLFSPEHYKFDNIDLKYKSGKIAAEVRGDAQVDMKTQDVSADLTSVLGGSHVKAKLGMTNFSEPAYRFDVGMDKLDADNYLSGGSKSSGPEKPFDLSFLKKLDAKGKLAIASLKVHGLRLSQFSLGLKASNSRLSLAPISAVLYQGKMQGSASMEAAPVPRFALKQKLSGISIGPLLKDMAKKDIVDGKGDVSLDLSATGNLFSQLKKSLNGRASLHLFDGAIRGIDLAATLRGIKSKMGGTQSGIANISEKTDFSELSATFDIKNGVAHNSDLAVKSPLIRLGGEGNIDMGRSVVDYLAKVSVVATLQGQGGADLASLKGVTIPLHISGPFDSLHYSLDLGSLVKGELKSKVEQKKTEIKNKVKDELLKGIFGR